MATIIETRELSKIYALGRNRQVLALDRVTLATIASAANPDPECTEPSTCLGRPLGLPEAPVDRHQSPRTQRLVGLGEARPSLEVAVGPRRRMAGLEDDVAIAIDQVSLGSSVPAPEQEHDRAGSGRDGRDDGIREKLPTPAAMAPRPAVLDGQDGVEEEDASPCPRLERMPTPVSRQLGEDMPQRRRHRDIIGHRKRESLCLAWPVVRVLAEDDCADGLRRCHR